MGLKLKDSESIQHIYDICDKTQGVCVFCECILIDGYLTYDKMAAIVDYLRGDCVKRVLNSEKGLDKS